MLHDSCGNFLNDGCRNLVFISRRREYIRNKYTHAFSPSYVRQHSYSLLSEDRDTTAKRRRNDWTWHISRRFLTTVSKCVVATRAHRLKKCSRPNRWKCVKTLQYCANLFGAINAFPTAPPYLQPLKHESKLPFEAPTL
jgi:hypothetical protein